VILNSGICQNCFIKFNEFDEYQMMAKRIETEILQMFENSSELEVEQKIDVKKENEEETDDFEIVEVMLDDDAEINDYFQLPDQHGKSEKRSYKRKKNLDEGLVVVEVDGQKIYQCDICKKLCKDRYKLKTHREIHTTERKICCTVCGAMFKTLTCLYSHKKIHRERIYHQW
jgi:hypothetical protein